MVACFTFILKFGLITRKYRYSVSKDLNLLRNEGNWGNIEKVCRVLDEYDKIDFVLR